MKHSVRDEIGGVGLFLGLIWVTFLLNAILPIDLNAWGLRPRTLVGAIGILTAPFLHSDFGHILGNSIPLAVLLILMAGSRSQTWQIVSEIVVLGGALVWLMGRDSVHVGASGLVYGLIAYLITAGFLEKRPVSIIVALLVAFMYGGSLLGGIIPSVNSSVSWEGHLFGALGAVILAFLHVRRAGVSETATPQ